MFSQYNHDRNRAIEWARQMLEKDFVVIDTETTGFGRDAEIVQIGIVDKSGKVLLDTLVKPTQPIPAKAWAIHGIGDHQVANAPTIGQVYHELCEALKWTDILSYNAPFDSRMLQQSCRQRDLPTPADDAAWQCVMEQFTRFYGEWSDYRRRYKQQKLTVAARHLGIKTDGAHGAVADALMTLRVVEGMARAKLSTEEATQ